MGAHGEHDKTRFICVACFEYFDLKKLSLLAHQLVDSCY